MTTQLPSNLHLVHNKKKAEHINALTKKVKSKIPKASWLDNPDAWDKDAFIQETSDFLWDNFGIGADQDKHLLAMLAHQIEIYVQCMQGIAKDGIIMEFNAGQTYGANPYLTAGDKALTKIIALMNELGLTPKGRINAPKQEASKYQNLLNGP
ncbi:COG3747 Phage terminase, small subunit [uncultured Caudovirales phage]|uniref:COG3747 Phage terminase, small subunit n=1 Tax=uncultured Caudovirales phage TaxID=2100421 RepID=A0A6J5LGH6_9CAUD|nr:COG3747 Phage terminase, small subunit [uncultured Caudovirales phage]